MIILYYQLGTALERTWGAFKFNVYIFGGMIFTVLGALLLYVIYGVNTPISMGGSFSTYYINMTIFLAFAMCYPDMRIMLYFIIPIKMKWMAGIYAAFGAKTKFQIRIVQLCSPTNGTFVACDTFRLLYLTVICPLPVYFLR